MIPYYNKSFYSYDWESEVKENGQLFYIESELAELSEVTSNEADTEAKDTSTKNKIEKIENVTGG